VDYPHHNWFNEFGILSIKTSFAAWLSHFQPIEIVLIRIANKLEAHKFNLNYKTLWQNNPEGNYPIGRWERRGERWGNETINPGASVDNPANTPYARLSKGEKSLQIVNRTN